jgi:hypothetical protein
MMARRSQSSPASDACRVDAGSDFGFSSDRVSPSHRFVALLSVVTVAAAAAESVAAAPAAACTPVAARSAVAHAKPGPTVPGLDGSRVPVTARDVDEVLCFDFTRDGRRDVALTVASGGTAGDIAWLVLVGTKTGFRTGKTGGGYKLGLDRRGSDVVVSQPVYRKDDPNCCPTGGFDHVRWHWNGHAFVSVRSWHTKSFRP